MKKSKLLLASWVLSILYFIYIVSYFTENIGSSTGTEQIGMGLAGALVLPHIVALLMGIIFNIIGWAMNKRGFALAGAILYTISLVLFPLYFMFVIVQMILSYIGYAKMKKPVADPSALSV